ASDVPLPPLPKAIIAPHAGYIYSGPIAASVYARLKPLRGRIERVVLLGPCHRVAVRGLALSGADAFATPLGNVPVDKEAVAALAGLPQVSTFDATHAQEHSLEVHLPFLQEILGAFKLVPLVVGDASADQVAEVLERLWGGPETLIVVSSDLSHYLDYDTANRLDRETCAAIESLDFTRIGRDQACGRIPVSGLLALAKRRGLGVDTLDLRNSGDTAGPRDRVVGYGAWMFFEKERQNASPDPENADDYEQFARHTREILNEHGETLLHTAAASIEFGLEYASTPPIDITHFAADLQSPGATFITLKRGKNLRGCIGSSQAYRPLIADTAENAYAAAFKDPRFNPLQAGEVDDLSLSVSVLSPSSPMTFRNEADLLRQLRPGCDGLIITEGNKRALFLPVVWETLAKPEDFLSHLKAKAGLAADHWSETFTARRFITEHVTSRDLAYPAGLWRSRPLPGRA
ncbi:MAG: AmmeMemoRadiSam system protein B, partial [Rhodospirillales bacterium]